MQIDARQYKPLTTQNKNHCLDEDLYPSRRKSSHKASHYHKKITYFLNKKLTP